MDDGQATKKTRLGFGEFEPADGVSSRVYARTLFLAAVRRFVPAVLQALADQPLAAFSVAVRGTNPDNVRNWVALREAADDETPSLTDLQDALLTWAQQYHLDADWCLDRSLRTLRAWASQPPYSPLRRDWDYEVVGQFLPTSAEERRIFFTHPGWEPVLGLLTRAEAERVIRDSFDRYLRGHLDAMEEATQRAQVWPEDPTGNQSRPAPQMRRTPEKRSPEHFEWLARYQVEGLSFSKLAHAVYRSRPTVTDAVKRAADFIGLPLREPDKPGRPPKKP